MSEVFKVVENIADQTVDFWEKTRSPASRAGYAVERAAKLAMMGVSHRVIACQLSDNSPIGMKYKTSEIPTLLKLHADAQAGGVGITTKQATALRRDQEEQHALPTNAKLA